MLRAGRDSLGQPVTYRPASTGTPQMLRAIFSRRSIDLSPVGDVGVREQVCELRYRAADFSPAPVVGDTIVVAGQTFRVAQPPQADGEGGAILQLSTESV